MSHHINPRSVFIILPAYNEHAVIQSVVDELLYYNYQLVVVDDGSATSLYPLLKQYPIYFLRHPVNLGQGAALQTGIEFALAREAHYIVTFDADGQHKASDVEKLLEAITTTKVDIVLGSRFIKDSVRNVPAKRKMLLKVARYINYFFTGVLLTDAHNGLRAMTKKAAEHIKIQENGMAHATELLSQIKRRKLRYSEIPVSVSYTAYSRKKGQTVWNSFRIFFDLLLNKIFK